MASKIKFHVGYSHANDCWFVRFYPYQTQQQAENAAEAFTHHTREQVLEEAARECEKRGAVTSADAIRELKSQQNTETSAIEKKKFYHNEWPHDALMAARRDGFIDHNGGEAWRYQFTHKDEKGKYDLLYRDTSNSSIQAALPPVQTGGGE